MSGRMRPRDHAVYMRMYGDDEDKVTQVALRPVKARGITLLAVGDRTVFCQMTLFVP